MKKMPLVDLRCLTNTELKNDILHSTYMSVCHLFKMQLRTMAGEHPVVLANRLQNLTYELLDTLLLMSCPVMVLQNKNNALSPKEGAVCSKSSINRLLLTHKYQLIVLP